MDERERHLSDAQRYAKQAERWSTVAMWGSGCALAIWVAGILLAVVVGVGIYLALT
jgi:hypothetical protein